MSQVSYISQNWPILHVVASKDGMYLAIAGLHGLILYDIRSKKWRVFGDITQEQMIQCKGLLWLGKIVVICNYMSSSDTYELFFTICLCVIFYFTSLISTTESIFYCIKFEYFGANLVSDMSCSSIQDIILIRVLYFVGRPCWGSLWLWIYLEIIFLSLIDHSMFT